MQNFLIQFWSGLTKPSYISTLGSIAIALAGLIFIAISYDAKMVREGGRWVYTDKHDLYGYLSVLVERLRHAKSGAPLLIYGGASNSGRALVSPPYFDQLVKRSYPHLDTFAFWGGGLSMWEMEAIAVAAKGLHGSRKVKLLLSCTMMHAIGPRLLDKSFRERLLLTDRRYWDEILEAEGVPVPARIGLVPFDNHNFFLSRYRSFGDYLFRKPALPNEWFINGTPENWRIKNNKPFVPKAILEGNKRKSTRFAELFEKSGLNLDRCQRVLDRLKAQEIQVALFESPFSLEKFAGYIGREKAELMVNDYRNALIRLAQENEIPLIMATTESNFTSGDYRDMSHIGNNAARERYTTALVNGLSEWAN